LKENAPVAINRNEIFSTTQRKTLLLRNASSSGRKGFGAGGEDEVNKDLETFVQELMGLIEEEIREAYGDLVYERWLDPRHQGALDEPDGYARLSGSCDDSMELFLKFEGDRVREAKFRTNGCGTSLVCGSLAAEMALGKRPEELTEINGETILGSLGGLPAEDLHCAHLAGEALQAALRDFLKRGSGGENPGE
jgi:nitrogen fixation protein NifU and related proteins